MERCERYHWQFMIVLMGKDLKTVWREIEGLRPLQPNNCHKQTWGKRRQRFWWANDIEYYYPGKTIRIHVVVCEEEWEEVDSDAKTISKTSRHVWMSSRSLNRKNVHERCNLGARYRWGIEACFPVEKHQGYQYEYLFGLNWNAMRGYHHLMRIAYNMFNTPARFSTHLAALYGEKGVRGAIHFIRQTCAAAWLNDKQRVLELLNRPFRLQFE